jgi:putative two-component system response regulator
MEDNLLNTARILIVDDQPANVMLLEAILEDAEFISFRSVLDSRQALPTFIDYLPDLILLDLQMPHLDGFAVLKQVQACLRTDDFLPILVLTADITPEAKRRALSEGAMDFLTKPFDAMEVILRIKNLLRTRSLHLQLQGQNRILDQKVRERTTQLEATQTEILERLALAAEYRDDNTGEHIRRVGETAECIAQALGWSASEAELIRRAAPLHDVGKIAIPDAILLKPGKLTPAEFEVMKTHTTIGARILSGGRFPLLQLAEQIALTHHERWDGTGYIGLQGEAIPLPGRIVSLVDVFDALTSERPYKKAWSLDDTVAEIQKQRGRQFDPQLVDVLLEVIDWQPVV